MIKARVVTELGTVVEGILVTPKNERFVRAFERDVLNTSTSQYYTISEAASVLAYVLSLLEEPEETTDEVDSEPYEPGSDNVSW